MKIFAISNNIGTLPNYQIYKEKHKTNVSNPVISGFPSQNILANYQKANLVNFGNSINFEYFKLPIGASPDEYQISAAKSLDAGDSVLVSAPTGTGKTAIAQYVISKNLAEGKRTFYTTPLKALSNQKLLEFKKIYGDENVGILTGDRKENARAPIIVMTTEVYRNMAFDQYFNNRNNMANDVRTIIFDEFHYLGDPDRGASWEEAIVFSPSQTQILGLSATIGNDGQLSQWLGTLNSKKVSLVHVPSQQRHVPLVYHQYDAPKEKLWHYDLESLKFEQVEGAGLSQKGRNRKIFHREQKLPYSEDYVALVNNLDNHDKLPAIFFVFSKSYSNRLLNDFIDYGRDLTTEEEKEKIDEILHKYEKKYGYIGQSLNEEALYRGYAVHNAGILPVQKEMIEELFNKKLVKVVFATETLAAGINMPARTVVITSPEKPSSNPMAENGRRDLTPNEYHQMSGRAGRRGIDIRGHVINMTVNPTNEEIFKKLVVSDPNSIYSVFEPDYSLIASYHKYTQDSEKIKNIFANSFKIFAAGESKNDKKINSMYKKYEAKCDLLAAEGFLEIDKNRNKTLTSKGEMLHNIVGYPQIPLINLITSHALQRMSPEELVYLAGSIVGGQYHSNNKYDEVNNLFINPASVIKHNLFNIARFIDESPAKKDFSNIQDAVKKFNIFNTRYKKELDDYHINDDLAQNLNHDVGALVYTFAYLNSQRRNKSIFNWKLSTSLIPQKGAIKDEGGYYNAVNQTIDLLSQMIDLCNDTKNVYELRNDRTYYKILADKLKIAILLLKQDPVQNFVYEKN